MATCIARSVRGLEWVVAAEISSSLPATGIGLARREVRFQLAELEPDLLDLRTADDVFLAVGRVPGFGPASAALPTAARRLAGLDWAAALARLGQVRELAGRPGLDVVASLEGGHGFNRFAAENAVGAALAPVLSGSYLARTGDGRAAGQPDLTVRVFVRDGEAVAALRIAARPLHRREYKQDSGPGSLHPPAAAALARRAGPAPLDTVADPFCGDGTIAIEAALSDPGLRVLASDIDPARLASARKNAARAGLPEGRLSLAAADAALLRWPPGSVAAVITNPPWNVAVDAGGLLRDSPDRFWRRLPALLAPGGRLCLIADLELDAPGRLTRLGYQLTLATQVRLAGRVSQVLLCGPPGHDPPQIPAALADWRQAALTAGVATEAGF